MVDCEPEVQLARLMARDGTTRAEALAMLAAQAPREERLAVADDVIHNDGDIARLRDQVEKLHRQYVTAAKAQAPAQSDKAADMSSEDREQAPMRFTEGATVAQNSPMSEEAQKAATANIRSMRARRSAAPLIFEQPLNERMRTFLRLDFLYSQALYHNEMQSQWGSRAAMGSLLDILAIAARGDVRADVQKELERHLAQLNVFQSKPGVDSARLRTVMSQPPAPARRPRGLWL